MKAALVSISQSDNTTCELVVENAREHFVYPSCSSSQNSDNMNFQGDLTCAGGPIKKLLCFDDITAVIEDLISQLMDETLTLMTLFLLFY